MAEPRAGRDSGVEENLEETLVEILRPEIEAVEQTAESDRAKPSEPATAGSDGGPKDGLAQGAGPGAGTLPGTAPGAATGTAPSEAPGTAPSEATGTASAAATGAPTGTAPTGTATGVPTGTVTGAAPGDTVGDEPAGSRPQTTDKDFFHALGGWGALLDIGLPWIAFLIVYAASDHDLRLALIVAIACGAAVALLRLVRKQPLRNVLGGFIGVLISAWVANRSGRAEDVYLPGLLTNLGYGLLYLLTVLLRWPLFGVVYGLITQTGTAWRRDPAMLRGFSRATLVFVGLFAIRLIVQTPLYLTGSLNALGIAKVGLGLPFYALALWLAYAVLRGSLPPDKWDEARDHVTHLLGGGKNKKK